MVVKALSLVLGVAAVARMWTAASRIGVSIEQPVGERVRRLMMRRAWGALSVGWILLGAALLTAGSWIGGVTMLAAGAAVRLNRWLDRKFKVAMTRSRR